jgi:hypothetical protein
MMRRRGNCPVIGGHESPPGMSSDEYLARAKARALERLSKDRMTAAHHFVYELASHDGTRGLAHDAATRLTVLLLRRRPSAEIAAAIEAVGDPAGGDGEH